MKEPGSVLKKVNLRLNRALQRSFLLKFSNKSDSERLKDFDDWIDRQTDRQSPGVDLGQTYYLTIGL